VGANLHGGGNGTGYTPIADSNGVVVGARPEFYGMLMFTLAGTGTLYQTTVAAGGLNVTAYAVKTAAGGLNVMIVNKDSTNNLLVTVNLPQTVKAATLLEMTQLTAGASVPDITATAGVTIQSASVGVDGTFVPGTANGLAFSGSSVTCYAPVLSAVLVQVS
jgi:hypothetical protein